MREAILRVLQEEGGLSGREVCRRITGDIAEASRYRRMLKQMRDEGEVVNDTKEPYVEGKWRIRT